MNEWRINCINYNHFELFFNILCMQQFFFGCHKPGINTQIVYEMDEQKTKQNKKIQIQINDCERICSSISLIIIYTSDAFGRHSG